MFEFVLDDGTGRLHCRWWNVPFMARYFAVDDEVLVFGKTRSLKPRTIDHPETEVLDPSEERSIHMDRIVPIYPLTEGLPQRWLRSLIWRTLMLCEEQFEEPRPELNLPNFFTRAQAIRQIHFPEKLGNQDKARERLAFDEFYELQVTLQRRRRHLQTQAKALPCQGNNELIKPFLSQLGFNLTNAQTKVLRELRSDLCGPYPMRRLLQGDVGSGKTVIAACTALMAAESGFNAVLMVPTEILAEQHFHTFTRWFKTLGVEVELRTAACKGQPHKSNSSKTPPSHHAPTPPASPASRSLVIGTHAVLQSSFDIAELGLVIIDEQHKFGVVQRETLVRKGCYPHLLVMTATPIPRTLGLTLYGDLDISIIDHSPQGRGRVRTFVRSAKELQKVHAFIRQKLTEGRQAFIVFPRVEEADTVSGIKAVAKEQERLKKTYAPHQVGLLHGRLRPDEKAAAMTAFRSNQIQVLLATSVVEVGVDVPNATVMLIENADQFGLAQLHQLRGRIGRGIHESFCILVAEGPTVEARKRLNTLASSSDGFKIAEADLDLRGPGEFLGQQQSGLPPLRFGDLKVDLALVKQARDLALANQQPVPGH
jgi:ATP-dependent DNA helicase RecG